MGPDIEQYVTEARKGNGQSFYRLVSLYRDQLYKTAWHYLRNEPDALEAVQEVTCRAFMKIGKLKEPAYFSTWLIRIMIHYCLDELKRSKRVMPVDSCMTAEMQDEAELDTRLDLNGCIQALKPRYRDVIVLKYYEDMSVEAIAAALNRPEGTIKTWISRGLGQLRKSVKGREEYA